MANEIVFRSDMKHLFQMLAKLALAGSVLLIVATIIGQYRADRFPGYIDLTLSLAIAPAVCGALAALFAVAVRIFVVKVSPTGLRCYNTLGLYKFIAWQDIHATAPVSIYGLRYVYVLSPALAHPVTVPLFLEDADSFKQAVMTFAGPLNPLSQALNAAT